MIVVPITLLLIFVLLYSLFNSLRDSLLALAGIPFAIGGGLIALFVAGLDFSISAAIGFISLFGVAVMDGILNITYFRELRAVGHEHRGGGVQRRRAAHAADADDGAVRRRRPVPRGAVPWHRQPGAAAACRRSWSAACSSGRCCCWWSAPALRKIFLSREPAPVHDDARPSPAMLRRPEREVMSMGGRAKRDPAALMCRVLGVGTLGMTLGIALAGCAVGPNFSSPPAPDVNRYTPEALASPSSGVRRAEGRIATFRHWRGHLHPVVGSVSVAAAQRPDPAVGRAQSVVAGGGSSDPGRPVQRTGAAWPVLPPGRRELHRQRPAARRPRPRNRRTATPCRPRS